MEEPQRSIVDQQFKQFKEGWEASLDRTRANLEAKADPLDIIAAEGALLYGQEGMTAENLAFFVAAAMVAEAQKTPKQRGARKAPVAAKKPRKRVGPIEHEAHPLEGEAGDVV